ncbi:chemerin-like receptor 1 [Polymixia lowei]
MTTVGSDNYDYDYGATVDPNRHSSNLDIACISRAWCVIVVVMNVIICLLGLCGNGAVIWIAGFKMKKTVNTTWYFSLAISDFLYCATIPFSISQKATHYWIFGLFMCKFTNFVMFLNMYSSIFLMVIISVDRCVAVTCPVWAQNHRTLKRASAIVVITWLISMALSVPSLVFRDVTSRNHKYICINNFTLPNSDVSTAVVRFAFGFVLPLIIITMCCSFIILRLRTNKLAKTSKPLKVMTVLIVTFLVCWLPYHVFSLLEINLFHHIAVENGLKISVIFATANSCMNPFLYAFMGKDFKQKFWSSFLSKIESTFYEEGLCERSKISSASSKTSSTV